MVRIILLLILASIFYSGMAQQADEFGHIVNIDQKAPLFTANSTDGDTINLADLRGKVVMLQFTASWCGVCRREMPHIENEIWQKHKNNPNFALYGIDLDEPKNKVVLFANSIPITYPMLLDPDGEIFYKYADKGAGVTRNIIIDKNGKIAFLTRLYKSEEFEKMKAVIDSLLQ